MILIGKHIRKQRDKGVMRQRVRIITGREAIAIIEKVEGQIRNGEKLTDNEREDYLFAGIFLSEIKKRKKRRFLDVSEQK
jgi:hypothetical protein